jgi:hypothetical protein
VSKLKLGLILTCLLFSLSFSQERLFAIGVDEGPNNDFGAALTEAMDMGMNAVQLFLGWSEMEPDSGQYNIAGNFITWAPAFYAGYGLKVVLYINPIHMVDKTVPADLKDKAWDDPEMIARYNALIDSVTGYIGNETVYFVIGNEVDMAVLADSADYAQYKVFFNATKAHFQSLHPDIPVGVVIQTDALFDDTKTRFALDLQEAADLLMVTYYGGSLDVFGYIDPDTLVNVFDAIVAKANGKEVIFTELGYPSSPVLNSTQEKQADFISNAFAAWEKHKDTIPYVLIMKQWEWSRDDVLGSGWFDSTWYSETLLAFLTSIGLHDSLGNEKIGWQRLREEAQKYGFIGIEDEITSVRNRISMTAVPNPFNSMVNIMVRRTANGVRCNTINVYNINGKLVANLTPYASRLTPYTFTWNPDNLAAGIYIIRAKAGNRTFQKRVTLVK